MDSGVKVRRSPCLLTGVALVLLASYSVRGAVESLRSFTDNLNREMNEEERVWAEELADRKRLGLVGNAAIIHYNEWMDRHGMEHLKVPYQF